MNSLRHGTPETPENHGFKKNAVADAVAKIMNHYVPKEGDSMQTVADILGVVPASLKNNLFILPVGHLMSFNGENVIVAHTGGTSTQFPALAANQDSYKLAA